MTVPCYCEVKEIWDCGFYPGGGGGGGGDLEYICISFSASTRGPSQ